MHIRQCTAADLPTFATVAAAAMYNDEMIKVTAPLREKYYASYRHYYLLRTRKRFYSGEWMFLAVTDENDPEWDGTEKAMGFSAYNTTLKSVQKPRPGGWLQDFERLAAEWNVEYYNRFKISWAQDSAVETRFRAAMAAITSFDGLPDRWELRLLGVHPDYQRKGVGSALLKWGFERAIEYQVPIILSATLQGEKVYLKHGYRELERWEVVDGVKWAMMAWFPPGKESALEGRSAEDAVSEDLVEALPKT